MVIISLLPVLNGICLVDTLTSKFQVKHTPIMNYSAQKKARAKKKLSARFISGWFYERKKKHISKEFEQVHDIICYNK